MATRSFLRHLYGQLNEITGGRLSHLIRLSDSQHQARKVYVNEPQSNEGFSPNRIINTKYTVLTFLPLNLMDQFRSVFSFIDRQLSYHGYASRFMNQYFLLVAILQLFPTLTPVSPVTTWVPLGVIFTVSAFKEAMDDYRRHKADREANRRMYSVIRDGHLSLIQSQQIMVGDIIKVEENHEFPCDMVILTSSEPLGSCYVQTSNIDGETDLKPRIALPQTASMSLADLGELKAEIHCAPPNNHIYEFDASMQILDIGERSEIPLSLSAKQLLLQGTFLRNTDYVFGSAVYLGKDTKIALNKHQSKTKWTRVDRRIDLASRFVFVLQLVVVLVFGLAGNAIAGRSFMHVWYLDLEEERQYWFTGWVIPFRMLLLLSFMIPISLKVSLDLAKFIAAQFIGWDLEMYDDATDEPAKAANTAIAEDLGQVEYIFTDKTGTLTENIMSFKRCTVDGKQFGCDIPIDDTSKDATHDYALRQAISQNETVRMFFRNIALCNSIVPSRGHHADVAEDKVVYRGNSPDEECLIKAAFDLGIVLLDRTNDSLKITVLGDEENYQIMQMLEFTSDRKRMSVVVRETGTQSQGRIILFTKGADDVVLGACRETESGLKATTAGHVDEFASSGFRTLCLGMRIIGEEEFKEWQIRYNRANASIERREQLLKECFSNLEHNLIPLGASAIEDRMQERVSETIQLLRGAGIKIWMLTGDKKFTAKQIAANCSMTSPSGVLIDLDFNHATDVQQVPYAEIKHAIDEHHSNVAIQRETRRSPQSSQSNRSEDHRSEQIGVIIDGESLRRVLDDGACTKSFLQLCLLADVVVCCRVTPLQKSKVVELVKKKGHITLAIGDGGNDVSMIQKANVGIGIKGREGQQAARAADYSIARFRYLSRLLLVHGRYSYKRTSFIALYCFYKSIFLASSQAFYQYNAGFSGTSFLNTFSLSTYNILFTGLPILFFTLDKDISEQMILKFPVAYQECVKGLAFNRTRVLNWIVRAIAQAMISYSFVLAAFNDNEGSPEGRIHGETNMALTLYTTAITIQTLTLILQSHHITSYNWSVILGTALFYFFAVWLVSLFPKFGMFGSAQELDTDPNYFFVIVIASVAAMLPPFVSKYYQFNYRPNFSNVIQRAEIHGSGLHFLGPFEMERDMERTSPRPIFNPPRSAIPLQQSSRSESPLLPRNTSNAVDT